jgi:hypothetical protein
MTVFLSNHASSRIRQRGYVESDIDLLVELGTDTRDGVILSRKDASNAISALKRKIAHIERLSGTYAVIDGDTVVTVYRSSKNRWREQTR